MCDGHRDQATDAEGDELRSRMRDGLDEANGHTGDGFGFLEGVSCVEAVGFSAMRPRGKSCSGQSSTQHAHDERSAGKRLFGAMQVRRKVHVDKRRVVVRRPQANRRLPGSSAEKCC